MEKVYFKTAGGYGHGSTVPENAKEISVEEYDTLAKEVETSIIEGTAIQMKKESAKQSALAKVIIANAEMLSAEELDASDIGFVNKWADDNSEKAADGKWYRFTSGKTRHKGDPYMSLSDAMLQGIEIG